ncbi:penicillin-binding protein activator [Frateuria hangzhouensis]|uniref:penicillin-binding protein activator n=1 Tax=Frateuria hangzhouensis TaxID=2995589 RepID=UPI002260FD3C|nr:penicillin-binding protein activator [Frateuria sp. STR12]MCX7513988.1 penicillin-binding protein activator [Frateuria sp. STR12]
MRLLRAAGLGLLIALAISACVPTKVTRSPQELAAAQHAEQLASQGQFDQAIQAYLELGRQTGDSDHYRVLAAEVYREEGAIEQAAPLLDQVRRPRLDAEDGARYDLLRAELALAHHDAHTALQLTTQPAPVPPVLELRLLELRARAMEAGGDLWGAARTRVQMDPQLQGLDHTQNRKQILDLLGRLGIEPLKRRGAAMQSGDRMLPWINEALTQLGVPVAQPQPDLDQPVGTMLPGADANVREGYRMPANVALLLPLGGNFAGASGAIRQGFFAAYADAARNNAPRANVRVYDSGGTAETALKAYQQAAGDGAQLIVGPLTRVEVAAVFAQPQLPVPTLALNHPDDKSLPAAGATEFGLLPETEGAQAADHMVERGLHGAYVVTSDDDFAQRAAGAFKAEFEARGGHIAGVATLPPGKVDYADAIAGLDMPTSATPLAGTEPAPAASVPASAGSVAATPEPLATGGTGIFISMRPEQARLLLPQLHVAQIGLPVFATSHIYAGVDDAAANRDLDGVEFCDAPWLFDAQPGLPGHDAIASRLPSARGTSARLFAFGMDAWNLVPYLDWLRDHPGSYLPGASGQLAADQFGRVRRVLVWARFQNGLARPLTGSLQLDDVPSSAPPASEGGSTPMPATSTGVPPATSTGLPPAEY